MVSSKASTADAYLAELPPDRGAALGAVRKVILDNLPDGYQEVMQYGMISYVVPLARYPTTYNGQSLGYAALASQKNYMSVYLTNVYGDARAESWFRERYQATGKRLDMGKSCVRFKKLDDLPLDVIGDAIARTPVDEFIRGYEQARKTSRPGLGG